ncbi:hypothetical protein jhhlp_003850 [Lomentospora prolificans]|uniref:Phosphotransferase n=1 Tax=Lomentospora prolificans TaxID=41688 RepID=A0A2N3N9W3_9PEZI|nr:hypothetical protein jhhlp_003850 [Lomentospora prolificans]
MTAQSLQAALLERKSTPTPLAQFLSAFHVDSEKIHTLTREFEATFRHLAAKSQNQFLPTPILTSLLRPIGDLRRHEGCLNSGGTNLRVGFVKLHPEDDSSSPTVEVLLERSCPIGEQLKHKNHTALFDWIGNTIAAVVKDGCTKWSLNPEEPLPMGVTFSFPMHQRALSEAIPMSMGKGFQLEEGTDLGSQLLEGYEKYRTSNLPSIRIAAIANDSVATLISFIYQYGATENRVPAMGLIVGTGCNATVTLPLDILGDKINAVSLGPEVGSNPSQTRLAVNTEWSINGTAGPLRDMGLITKWDEELDRAGETPGFQPLEYVTSGRYLGELGRIIFLDYLMTEYAIEPSLLPSALFERYSMSTTFLSYFGPPNARFLEKLENTFPSAVDPSPFRWNESHVDALYQIAQAIQRRAASILASATVALLRLAGEVPAVPETKSVFLPPKGVKKVGVGFTGGCIVNFQNYLYDYEMLLSQIISEDFGPHVPVEVEVKPCHCGGITGAGILAAAVLANEGGENKS